MFTWVNKYTIEVDATVQQVWEFFGNPNNATKWGRGILESYEFEDEPKAGTIVKLKYKNRKAPVHLEIIRTNPYTECETLIKGLLASQRTIIIHKALSPERTQVYIETHVKSFLAPLLRYHLRKCAEKQQKKFSETFLEEFKKIS